MEDLRRRRLPVDSGALIVFDERQLVEHKIDAKALAELSPSIR